MEKPKPIHPGEILLEEFIAPHDLTAGKVARAIGVPRTRIERLVRQEVDLTPDTALRLARLFGTTPQFWLNLQSRYALETTSGAISDALEHIQPLELAS